MKLLLTAMGEPTVITVPDTATEEVTEQDNEADGPAQDPAPRPVRVRKPNSLVSRHLALEWCSWRLLK